MTLHVRIKLRAKKAELIEDVPGYFEARLTRPPFESEANAELVALLAKHFKIAKSRVIIAAGATNRNKIVEIT